MGKIFINNKIIETKHLSITNNILYLPYPDMKEIKLCDPGRRIQIYSNYVNVKELRVPNSALLTGNIKYAEVGNCTYIDGNCKSYKTGNRTKTNSEYVRKEIKKYKKLLGQNPPNEKNRYIVRLCGDFDFISFATNITMGTEVQLSGTFDTVYAYNCLYINGNIKNLKTNNCLFKSEKKINMSPLNHTIHSKLESVETLDNDRIKLNFPEIEITLSYEEIKAIKDQIDSFYCKNDIINYFRKKNKEYDSSILNNNELLDDMTTDYEYYKQGDACDEEIRARKTEIIETILRYYEDELENYLL